VDYHGPEITRGIATETAVEHSRWTVARPRRFFASRVRSRFFGASSSVGSDWLMSRLGLLGLFVSLVCASPALAIPEFNKQWKERYLKPFEEGETKFEPSEDFQKLAKKAGCNLCHIKGLKKTERNEYGQAMSKYLKKEDFSKERLKAEPEKVKEEIIAALKKLDADVSEDGESFLKKMIDAKLPAVEPVVTDEQRAAAAEDDDDK
jgi:hypothetical protein